MFKYLVLICFFLILTNVNCQYIYYKDIFKGGVTGSGTSDGTSSFLFDSEIILNIDPLSTIKKAYLICYQYSFTQATENIQLNFNGNTLIFNSNDNILNYNVHISSGQNIKNKTFIKDVSAFVNSNQNVYPITIPDQSLTSDISKFSCFYLIVLYENNIGSPMNFELILNNQNLIQPTNEYELQDLNPIDFTKDVSIVIQSDILWDSDSDGSKIYIDNTQIGIIGGSDSNNATYVGAGVKGSFYYENGYLYGLDDDVANNQMNGSDGIAIINDYVLSDNDINLKIETNNPEINIFNNYISFPLIYTTTCDEFPTQTSSETTLCQGATAQLFASGGQSYSWQPTTGLSCTDCPNPIVTADSSRLYTVRIWNNDSCSVVRPIKVNVQPLPQFSGVGSTPTACGENTGSAIAVAQTTTPLPLSYSINGAPFAFSSTYTGNFANLSAGANTIILRDAFGCEKDTVIQIGVTNTTNAFFTATPNSGAAPLSVSFTNQSTNATNYNWFIESDFQGDNLLQHTFDTSGNYTVTLIAWQNDPLCADTFSIQIVVYDSLVIQIPNVFTPNGDGINDQFTITTNQPVTVEYHLFNRWGNVIAQDTKPTTAGSSYFALPIWDGDGYSDGTYFYVIRVVHAGKEYEFDGFLERIE